MATKNFSKAVYYSICSGACGACASTFGKLSGLDLLGVDSLMVKLVFVALMIVCNGGVWTFYVKALHTTYSTVSVTVIGFAANYLLSAIIGILIFKELTSLIWWCGVLFILFGMVLISLDTS